MITEKRFVRLIHLIELEFKLVDENEALLLFNKVLAHFPNKKDDLQHYCFQLDFGRCGEDYQEPIELYKQLTQ